MDREFVSIHNHTSIGSMLDALISVDDLFNKVKEFGQKAVAITDHGTLGAFYDAFQAYKRTGIKFIPGCEMYFVYEYGQVFNKKSKKTVTEKRKHIVLLAKNEIGYKNLLKINYIGYQHSVTLMNKVISRVSWDVLEKYSEGIICTSACMNGIISRLLVNGEFEKACEEAQRLNNIFKDGFFLEIQPHLLVDKEINQKVTNNQLIEISRKYNIPLVVGVDVHYLTKDHEKYHDMLLAIKDKKPIDDPNRFKYGIDSFFVKTGNEVYDFLCEHHGEEVAKEAIENTVKIADVCELPDYMEVGKNHLPVFDPNKEPDYEEFVQWKKSAKLKDSLKEDAQFMRFKIYKGFKEKYAEFSKEKIKERLLRVKKELKVLEGNNFSSYMLIVADFIQWAKKQGILVGPGRGSASGSIVTYLLGISNVDPLEYGLLFERFQNAYKKDLPDIDVDFTSAGRDQVQEYCRNKYGIEFCAQISNINTYTPKSVIPNLVKSMRNVMPNLVPPGASYVKISDAIKNSIPDTDLEGKKVKTLKYAMELSKPLRDFAIKCPKLMEYADALVGLPKEYSTHAGGMCISDKPIIDFAPLRIDKNGAIAVQYEKNRCEAVGLVKIDFLAIITLDMIDETLKSLKKANIKGPEKMEIILLDDKETYEMIQNGDTKCVFQLGSSGMMISLCKQIKPNCIEDIATINALGRPSSSNEERMEYIKRRFGKSKITYAHPSLAKSTKSTYGFGIFEEQLMDVAEDVAGWDLNKADGLRKLTKLKGKNPKLALQLETDFIKGFMNKHSVSYEEGKHFWDEVISNFSKYGFNKSHAIAYSINGYITAYLKRHYPAAYLAAYLNMKIKRASINKDVEISTAKAECKRFNVNILPPDINRSGYGYEILDEKNIVMGFSAINGLGPKAVNEIVENQPYESFVDILRKTQGRILNKARMNILAKAGCFDSLGITRKDICDLGKLLRDRFNIWVKRNIDGDIKDGYNIIKIQDEFSLNIPNNEWSLQEKLRYEQEVLGELVSGTLRDLYPNFFIDHNDILVYKSKPNKTEVIIEFLITEEPKEFKIKTGKSAGKVMRKYRISDVNGMDSELIVWSQNVHKADKFFTLDRPVSAKCRVNKYNGQTNFEFVSIERVYGL